MGIPTNANGFDANGTRVANLTVQIDRFPNVCPICHLKMNAENFVVSWTNWKWLEAFYHCTNDECRRSFIAFYNKSGSASNGQTVYALGGCFPVVPVSPDFSDAVKQVSPTFVSIFTQALSAENHNLFDVAGPGYRKALEFLIKDYAISLHPASEADIKRLQIVPVISKFLTGESLPVVSMRAAWLGNDETHYERRWVGKDLADLKKLIEATVHFITMQRLVADLPVDMPDPKSTPKPSVVLPGGVPVEAGE